MQPIVILSARARAQPSRQVAHLPRIGRQVEMLDEVDGVAEAHVRFAEVAALELRVEHATFVLNIANRAFGAVLVARPTRPAAASPKAPWLLRSVCGAAGNAGGHFPAADPVYPWGGRWLAAGLGWKMHVSRPMVLMRFFDENSDIPFD